MPTVILLDVSLSMIKPITKGENTETTILHLAITGITHLLDHLSAHVKLEFVSLATFSSSYDTVVPFTRDLDMIKSKLKKVEEQDKTELDIGLAGLSNHVLTEWGTSTPCDVILFTDGGLPSNQLRNPQYSLSLPFRFPAKLHVICLSESQHIGPSFFKTLVDTAGPVPGMILFPEIPISLKSVQQMVQKLCHSCYTPYLCTLKCGNLTNRISVFPPPQSYTKQLDLDAITYTLSEFIEVFGFVDIADLGSPMAISRHLLVPQGESKRLKENDENDDEHDDGKMPSFCVLLHGALKVENMAGICTVGENWFGVLYSWADSKKKSNLMLSIFEPGSDAIPWLGDLNYLGAIEEYPSFVTVNPTEMPSFPLKLSEKRSYSQNNMVWVRQAGLQSDIQKILRHARKLPEKSQQFYKELNRVRRAAISFGFIELLETMAVIFERECTMLPNSVHPECATQLTHVAECLRRPYYRDISIIIAPLKTKYNNESDTFG